MRLVCLWALWIEMSEGWVRTVGLLAGLLDQGVEVDELLVG